MLDATEREPVPCGLDLHATKPEERPRIKMFNDVNPGLWPKIKVKPKFKKGKNDNSDLLQNQSLSSRRHTDKPYYTRPSSGLSVRGGTKPDSS